MSRGFDKLSTLTKNMKQLAFFMNPSLLSRKILSWFKNHIFNVNHLIFTLHVAHLKFMIVDLHFMNVRNRFPQFPTPSGSRILNFLPPHFAFFVISFRNTRLWVRAFVLGLTIESIWKELCVPIYNSLVLYQGYNSLVCWSSCLTCSSSSRPLLHDSTKFFFSFLLLLLLTATPCVKLHQILPILFLHRCWYC